MSGTEAHAAAVELKYRGVQKRKWGKYVAEIRLPNSRERIWLGSYDAAEKAARAFDAALFCLRGRTANFNFSDDPPEIAGAQSLSRSEIQAVAQRYGKSFGGGRQQVAADRGEGEFGARSVEEEAIPGYDVPEPVDLIDRSFWKMVDSNSGGNAEYNVGWVSDYGLLWEPGESEMLVYPNYEARVYEDEEEGFYHRLWNF